jgi:hypothetical protein
MTKSGACAKFAVAHPPGPHEYRLNPAVFFLKFVKRDRTRDLSSPLRYAPYAPNALAINPRTAER